MDTHAPVYLAQAGNLARTPPPPLGGGKRREEQYPLAVSTMYGLGDTIYQRPFLRALGQTFGEVFVQNPWPELLSDLEGVVLCPPDGVGALRTQAKSAARVAEWGQWPARSQTITARYYIREEGTTILEELERQLPLNGRPLVFDLPTFEPLAGIPHPYAVLRPVTYRREWVNTARPPLHEYVHEAAAELRRQGYHVVAVADVDPPHETIGEPIPIADTYYLRGELDTAQLLGLVQHADVCVGGIGWIVPAALAASTPLVGIHGGQGRWNNAHTIADPRLPRPARFVTPDPLCRCGENLHKCRKEIPDFLDKFREALDGAVTWAAA